MHSNDTSNVNTFTYYFSHSKGKSCELGKRSSQLRQTLITEDRHDQNEGHCNECQPTKHAENDGYGPPMVSDR